ncbi:uncharacterized protein LOC132502605 [Mesoplodon densirostris]|uniref:uncharacterized protein LOC132502605 n=1 Tax=Mesoplodon densirostris TaxID=48708 RepID=UPI0028DCB65C|nr:uncharacterized protein LOC132502605 [Mesoplodon densirostris]
MWKLVLALVAPPSPSPREPAGLHSFRGVSFCSSKVGGHAEFQGSCDVSGRALSGLRRRSSSPAAGQTRVSRKWPARHSLSLQLPRGWTQRLRQHQPGRHSRVPASSSLRQFLPFPHSCLALTSSPARAVGPEPGVAPRRAAALSQFQPRKQNSHRPPDTRIEQHRPRSSLAHAEKGRRERRGERVGLAEGGPERATPTAPTSLSMLRVPAVGTFRSAAFACVRRKWYLGPAFQEPGPVLAVASPPRSRSCSSVSLESVVVQESEPAREKAQVTVSVRTAPPEKVRAPLAVFLEERVAILQEVPLSGKVVLQKDLLEHAGVKVLGL